MLKDSLNALVAKANQQATQCRFGRLLNVELDEQTSAALDSAMRSSASTRAIWLELKNEGIRIDRVSVAEARACYRGQAECKCGIEANK